MEFDSDEQRQIYEKCKYIVKLWEHKFKRKNGRLPSKLDIREADSDVRNAYKTYFYLKASTLEKSFNSLEGFNFDDNVGPSNNDSTVTTQNEGSISHKDNPVEKSMLSLNNIVADNGVCVKLSVEPNTNRSFNTDNVQDSTGYPHAVEKTQTACKLPESSHPKITKKQQSKTYLSNVSIKFSKRNPRKAFDNTIKKKSVPDSYVISEEKLDIAQSVDEESELILTNAELDITSRINIQSTNLINNFNENKTKTLRTVDLHWLKRVSETTSDTSIYVDPYIDCPSNTYTDPEQDNVLDSDHIIDDSEDDEASLPAKKQKVTDVKSVINVSRFNLKNSNFANKKMGTAEKNNVGSVINVPNSKLRNSTLVDKQESSDKKSEDMQGIDIEAAESNSPQNSVSQQDSRFLSQEATKYICHEEQSQKSISSEPATQDDHVLFEKKVLRPRKINPCYTDTLSEASSSRVNLKTPKLSDDRRQRTKEVFERKVKSGNLNDNFIKVNLKKKTYSRGKKTLNYSKYRKQQWKKQKQARNKSNDAVDNLLPIEASEEDRLPTVAEANEKSTKTKKVTATKKSSNYPFGGDDLDDGWDIENKSFSEFMGHKDLNKLAELEESHHYPVDPLYTSTQNDDISTEIYEALQKFGYPSFRPGQEQAIRRVLAGKSTLVTLSTGSGKSLCYLLPAYLYSQRQRCITLVVSPLVSLMDDQVDNVPHFMKAAAFHTAQTETQRKKVKDAVAAGKISVLFVSPELLVSGEKSESLKSILSVLPPIAFACIDEAHCVSQWSHNFRPSYLLLCKILRESLKVQKLLGLTATATNATCNSITRHFYISEEEGVIRDVPLPDNLFLTVSRVSKKDEALLKLITSEEFSEFQSIIIYCTRRDECQRVAGFLRTYLNADSTSKTNKKRKRVETQAECYHAGLSASKRRSVQNAFMSGQLKIVVATVAFGMGINKADIRAVIHYNLPKNVESYVQEVGRAGRDRLPARCHVFLDDQDEDKYELRRYAYGDSIDRHVIRKVLMKIFIPCQCVNDCPKHEVCFSIKQTVQDLDLAEEMISTILCYLELHENNYVNILSPAYCMCKITYSKPIALKQAAEKNPPLSKAMKLFPNAVKDNTFEFPVIEVAATLGLNSGFCKYKLKNLEWSTDGEKTKRSPINVTFFDLGFRVSSPGNLTKNELDDLLNNIHEQCIQNENKSLLQLEAIHTILTAAEKEKQNKDSQCNIIRSHVREYFIADNPLEPYHISEDPVEEGNIANDVRALVSCYKDTNFTGRAVARIFHGIQSPNFQAYTWGRTKFWRSHLRTNFHTLSKIAAREILALH